MSVSVLVVEDNPLVQKLVKKLLAKTACEVDIAENGLDALNQFKAKSDYTLLIIDLGLPDMTGSEVAALIRSYEHDMKLSPVTIIGLTASIRKEDFDDAIFYGMNKVLAKPLTDTLVQTIFQWLDLSKPASNANENKDKVIDLFSIVEALNVDVESVEKMIAELVKMLPRDLKKIKNAFIKKDYDTLQFLAHYIKGGSSCCGTPRLSKAADILSMAIKEKDHEKFNETRIQSAYEELCEEISAVISEYKKKLKKQVEHRQESVNNLSIMSTCFDI